MVVAGGAARGPRRERLRLWPPSLLGAARPASDAEGPCTAPFERGGKKLCDRSFVWGSFSLFALRWVFCFCSGPRGVMGKEAEGRRLGARGRAATLGRGGLQPCSGRFRETARCAFSPRAQGAGGAVGSLLVFRSKSEVCSAGIPREPESGAGPLSRRRHGCCPRGARSRVSVFRSRNETAVLEPGPRAQKQWPAGAKLSLPDRRAARCWPKTKSLIVSHHLPF